MRKTGFLNRLSVKFSFGVFLLLAIPAGIAIAKIGSNLKNSFRQTTLNDLSQKLDLKAEKALSVLNLVKGEVRTMTKGIEDDMLAYPDAEKIDMHAASQDSFYQNDLHNHMVSHLTRHISHSGFYLELRIILPDGRELIRLNRSESEIEVVPQADLQNKAQRKYFRHFIEDSVEEVHLPPLSLKKEHEKIVTPHTLMMRLGQRIYTKNGSLFGVLILNVHADMVFGNPEKDQIKGFLITDDEGSYLHHWDRKLLYGKDLAHKANVLREEPELKLNIKKRDFKIHYDAELKEFRVWKKVFFEKGLDAKRYWIFMIRVSESSIVSPWFLAVKKGLWALALVLASSLALSVFLIYKTLLPLKKIESGMKEMASGNLEARIEVKGKTELSHIADTFNKMAGGLKNTTVSKDYMDSIIKNMANSLVVASNEMLIEVVNQAACDLLGYEKEELLGQPFSLILAEKKLLNGMALRDIVKKSSVKNVEKAFLSKDGREIPVLFSASLLFDKDASAQGMVCVAQDLTLRKKDEEKIFQHSWEKAMSMEIGLSFTTGGNLKNILQRCMEIVVSNMEEAFAVIWALNEKELSLTVLAAAGEKKHIESIQKHIPLEKYAMGLIAATKRPYQTNRIMDEPELFDEEWVRQAGIISFSGFPLVVQEKNLGVIAVFSRKPLPEYFFSSLATLANTIALGMEHKQIEEDRAKLEMAVNQADEAIVVTDLNAVIQYANPAFERTTGYSVPEAIGKRTSILKSGKVDDAVYRDMWITITRGESWHGHFINKKKDGSFYEEDVSISPILDRSGQIINYVAVKHDVTSEVMAKKTIENQMNELQKYSQVLLSILEDTDETRKELEAAYKEMKEKQAQLVQSSKLASIGELTAGVAHELNQPIMVIRGFTQMMLRKKENFDEISQRNLEIIEKSTSKMMMIINHLRSFSRKSGLSRQEIDISIPIEDAFEFVHDQLKTDNVTIQKNYQPNLPKIKGDEHQLEQVFLNLISNSRYAMDKYEKKEKRNRKNWGKIISVKTGYKAETNRVWIEFSDTGGGIPKEHMDNIFDPFFTSKEVGDGTGLGLSISYGIIKEHNGEIEASNNDKGAVFKILLPGVSTA